MTACINKTKPLLVTKSISVATYDIDFAGHVSNIAYLRWFEELRLQIFDEYYPLQPLMNEGLLPIISATKVEYKRAIKLFDKPEGTMWIGNIGAASLTFRGEVLLNGHVATTAEHTGLFINATTQKPVRLPAEFVKLFRECEAKA